MGQKRDKERLTPSVKDPKLTKEGQKTTHPEKRTATGVPTTAEGKER